MNDPMPTRRPPQSASPRRNTAGTRNTGNPRRRRRRSRRSALRPLIFLILVSMGIGFLIGVNVGKARAEAAQLREAASEQTQDTTSAQPQETTAPQSQVPETPADVTGPQIMGVNELSMFLGGTIAYRSGILVIDDTDPAPVLTVDNSQVDLSTPGTYPLYYNATDSSGNVTTVTTTITVKEAPDTYVDEAIIKETADKLLAEILTEGMTAEEQVNAIYDYMESHCYYIANFDKTDYMQAAYLMMTDFRGDCFGFYALSRLLFDRLGIENLSVTRMENEIRTSSHYWNMVSLDDGETWYHFDATPHMTYPTRTCLVTDADLEAFNQLMPNYYYFDTASFPRTPVE